MNQPETLPKVIFFDAVGTLFGVQGSVGEIYSDLAGRFGVQAEAEHLDWAFGEHFKQASPMAFPNRPEAEIPDLEFQWWKAIAIQTFQAVGVLSQFEDFDGFFDALYAHFATADPWFVYPDTWLLLEHWQNLGVAMGVLSNFDSRLYPVLEALGLDNWFQSVTISTAVGAAKPSAEIFDVALQKHGCRPTEAWHVGDSYRLDYQGAKAAGLRAIWLNRNNRKAG